MKGSPEERAALLAQYMIESGDTVRGAAKKFCVSKSTVHKDLSDRLSLIDKSLYDKVSSVLKYHADIKHIRGGESTKRKFLVKKM